jgi:hypothetical protein
MHDMVFISILSYTPEGIDQNPVYYEFMAEQNFRATPEPNITAHVIQRAHRRYGYTTSVDPDVTAAWFYLANATCVQDFSGWS